MNNMPCADAPQPEPLAAIADARAWFHAFTEAFMRRDPNPLLALKVRHTECVAQLAGRITQSLDLDDAVRRSALLAALLHDVGRFPQFEQWHTFRDDISVNHGTLGARLLRDAPVLNNEAPAVRRMVILAVALHNRYILPAQLPDHPRLVTNIVRDADKIDILRIFSEELDKPELSDEVVLHVANDPQRWTPEIADMVARGQVPNYKQLRYVNDFIMLLGSWLQELNFPVSVRLVREAGYIRRLMDCLPRVPELDAVRRAVLDRGGHA